MRTVISNAGFSLIGVLMGITIIGILAVLAKPSVDALIARGRMAEAKMNLELIRRAQDAWLFDTTNNSGGTWEQFDAIGYTGSGSFACTNNTHTFHVRNCKSLRYNYTSNVSGTAFEVVAHAPSDSGNWLYPSCEGAGSSVYGKTTGDVWTTGNGSVAMHCRDVRLFCQDSGTANPNCGTPLGRSAAARVRPDMIIGSGSGSGGGSACSPGTPYPCGTNTCYTTADNPCPPTPVPGWDCQVRSGMRSLCFQPSWNTQNADPNADYHTGGCGTYDAGLAPRCSTMSAPNSVHMALGCAHKCRTATHTHECVELDYDTTDKRYWLICTDSVSECKTGGYEAYPGAGYCYWP